MIKNMNSKMTTNNYQQLNLKHKQKQTKQTTRTGTESQKWRSHGGLTVGRRREKNGGKDTRNKKHKWQVQSRQGEVKNGMGNGEAKELTCMINGYELRGGECWWEGGAGPKGIKGGNGTSVIA